MGELYKPQMPAHAADSIRTKSKADTFYGLEPNLLSVCQRSATAELEDLIKMEDLGKASFEKVIYKAKQEKGFIKGLFSAKEEPLAGAAEAEGIDFLYAQTETTFAAVCKQAGMSEDNAVRLKALLLDAVTMDNWRKDYVNQAIKGRFTRNAVEVDKVQKTNADGKNWKYRNVVLTEGMFIYTEVPKDPEGKDPLLRGRYRISPQAEVTRLDQTTSSLNAGIFTKGEKVWGISFLPNPEADHERASKTFTLYCDKQKELVRLICGIEANRRYAQLMWDGLSTETEYVQSGMSGSSKIRGANRPSEQGKKGGRCVVM